MEATQNNQVAIIQNSVQVLNSAPEILLKNQERKDKAIGAGRKILTAIQEEGMNQELDEAAMNYIVKVAAASKDMKEQRSSVTQIMDALKKMYTEVEAELDIKKEGTIPAQLQAHRNQYAAKIAKEQEERRRAAEIEAAKKQEEIDIKANIETNYLAQFSEFKSKKKQAFTNTFNAITLETFEEKSSSLRSYTANTPAFNFNPTVYCSTPIKHHSDADLKFFVSELMLNKEESLKVDFIKDITDLVNDLIEKLPSKKAELLEAKRLADEAAEQQRIAEEAEKKRREEMAKADEAQKEALRQKQEEERRLEQERQAELRRQQEAAAEAQRKREQEEADRIAKQKAEEDEMARQDAEIKRQGEQTMVMFEKEAAVAEVAQDTPEARQGYEIEVLHAVGYTQIFALWFEKVGKDLPLDKLGNTKLDQMKAWAEKEAHKSNTRIDSKFIKYVETFKAVNRKAGK